MCPDAPTQPILKGFCLLCSEVLLVLAPYVISWFWHHMLSAGKLLPYVAATWTVLASELYRRPHSNGHVASDIMLHLLQEGKTALASEASEGILRAELNKLDRVNSFGLLQCQPHHASLVVPASSYFTSSASLIMLHLQCQPHHTSLAVPASSCFTCSASLIMLHL
jgi:hypothetical protein